MKKDSIIVIVVSLLVIGSIIYGFTTVGFPANSRGEKLDATRVEHLRNIKSAIESYASSKNVLPKTLQEVKKDLTYTSIKDPETEKEYGYFVTGEETYKLCANFATASEDDKNTDNQSLYYDSYTAEFRHPKGEHCFVSTYNFPAATTYAPDPTSVPAIVGDINVLSIATSDTYEKESEFPQGFFSADPTESGFIQKTGGISASIIVTFKQPVILSAITNTFGPCSESLCYNWSAQGETEDYRMITLAHNVLVENNNLESTAKFATNQPITKVYFQIFGQSEKDNKSIIWKKIKFTYK
jgi:hypothetical protein